MHLFAVLLGLCKEIQHWICKKKLHRVHFLWLILLNKQFELLYSICFESFNINQGSNSILTLTVSGAYAIEHVK